MTRILGAIACGYVLGCTPTADLVARALKRARAVRAGGTSNPGALNTARILGRRAGLAVAAGDIAKGSVACVLGRAIAGDAGAHAAGVGAVAGHCYPISRPGRGGKGVATSFGQCLATFPAFAPLDVAVAAGVARLAGDRRPALAGVAASSASWIAAGVVWWRHDLPNLWGPRPSGLLPLANAATAAVLAARGVEMLRRGEPDELALAW